MGLHAVLGSLYHNQIELDLDNAEGVLSAASVLQLESVLERCGDAMAENLSANNVLRYLNLAEMYGLPQWIFLKEKPHAAALPDSDFVRQMNETFASFPEGQLFVRHAGTFKPVLLFLASLTAVENDKLIPKEVLRAVMVDQWKTALTNEENPTAVNELSMDDFHVNALRLGRLIDNMPKCWRWTGFNNGVDIVMSMSHGAIISDSSGVCLFDSTKQSTVLRLDQSVVVARLGDDITLPISVHLLYLAAQPAPPSFLYVNQYIKDMVRKEDEGETNRNDVIALKYCVAVWRRNNRNNSDDSSTSFAPLLLVVQSDR
ncbi:hypothetical protein ANCCEY_00521 [Ancylostoma ceylanicum]|uniref:BACK domain-containing protein n=1 Tax=Ancylostoma ceylanicum TaxID=53326 RepID=A0A0D6M8F6_9BILA|nr:hypothetical protein ANCCEY_00521 [Ancylostoma ceylanicum]